MKAYTHDEVAKYLSENLKDWKFEGGTLNRELNFRNFVEAFSFMTSVAFEAEKMNHHPDWSNSYNKVSISLKTHSENGITKNDLDLAKIINEHYRS